MEGIHLPFLQSPLHGAANTLERLAALNKAGVKGRLIISYLRERIPAMSPKSSRHRPVPAQSKPQSAPHPDGVRRISHPIPPEPSPAQIERWDFLTKQEDLAWRFQRAGALIHAMSRVADYHAKYNEGVPDELDDLAELGKEYCQDASRRTYELLEIFRQWEEQLRDERSPVGKDGHND